LKNYAYNTATITLPCIFGAHFESNPLIILFEREAVCNKPYRKEENTVDPVNQYQKLYIQLYQLLMMGVNTRNM